MLKPFFLASLILCQAVTAARAGDDEGRKTDIAYFELKPSLVSNVNGAAKYIRCDVQLMTENPDNLENIQLHDPALRHELLMMFADEDGGVLMTPDGKESLRKRALGALQGVLKEKTGKSLIEELYFTRYYVQ